MRNSIAVGFPISFNPAVRPGALSHARLLRSWISVRSELKDEVVVCEQWLNG